MSAIPTWLSKPTLILGCGNVLFGDDGFGPAVAEYILQSCKIPEDVCVLSAGTSAGKLLFDIALSEERRPTRIILIDAVTFSGRTPGELFELSLDALPPVKHWDFSLHQAPGANLLGTLRDECRTDIVLLVVQAAAIPQEVRWGLSP